MRFKTLGAAALAATFLAGGAGVANAQFNDLPKNRIDDPAAASAAATSGGSGMSESKATSSKKTMKSKKAMKKTSKKKKTSKTSR
jgi:hypothetical protein